MAKPILLLRLEGPLQSWGTRAKWDVRDTAPEPTKSGIIGLLGCALGCPMYDPRLEEMDRTLRFGVRIENPGRVLVDYQTITDYLPTADGRFKVKGTTLVGPAAKLREEGIEPATILSSRAYLEDAAFLAALEQADGGAALLAECAKRLQHPEWPLFLGRKACIPTRPIYDAVTEDYDNLEDALHRHPWSWLGAAAALRQVRQRPSHLEASIEVPDRTPGPNIALRQDAIRTNAARVYAFHSVKRLRLDFPGEEKAT
jgi:CRISPR system Cascade subunit CasD